MITGRKLFLAFVVWSWISGYYLKGDNYGISLVVGAVIFLVVWHVTKQDNLPIINEIPKPDRKDDEDVDFSKLPGYVQTKDRRPIPKNPKNP